MNNFSWSRRRVLQGSALLAVGLMPCRLLLASDTPSDITAQLARYMVASRDPPLPDAVAVACKNQILDTFGAMISGSRMRPGELALRYVEDCLRSMPSRSCAAYAGSM